MKPAKCALQIISCKSAGLFVGSKTISSWAVQGPVLNKGDALLTLTELSSLADKAVLDLPFLPS